MTATEIIQKNSAVIEEFFVGIASGNYYDNMCWRLYLDLHDGTITENVDTENNWLQRGDGSLVEIARVHGYDTRSQDEIYHDGDDIGDFGYDDWLEQLEADIEALLP